ncbi:MAG: hypothetical protein ACPIA2_12025 [Mariniblastus sp.]
MENKNKSEDMYEKGGFSESNKALGIFGFGAGLSCLAIISIGQIPTFLSGLLFVLFALAIGFRKMFVIYLFLLLLVCARYIYLVGFQLEDATLNLREILFTIFVFAFYGFSVRYIDLANAIESIYPDQGESLGPRNSQATKLVTPYPNPTVTGGRWYFIPIAILLGLALLLFFPIEIQNVRGDLTSRRATRLILIVLGIFICWFVSINIIKFVARWQMSSAQADVSIRSNIANILWRDQKRLEAYRYRRKRNG